MNFKEKLLVAVLSTALFGGLALADETGKVVVAYQTGVDPSKVVQADKQYEKATGREIDWRKFESGAEVIAAVASGDVVVGNIGSSPLAAATSRGLPIQTFLIAGVLGSSEAFVVRNGSNITKPEDLVGKKIAVPFVSTTHYSLLAALTHWGVDPKKVEIINLRPSEISAAWERGDIDAAYVWEPALGKAKASGTELTNSEEVGKWGSPTFDLWITRKDFAEKNPEFLTKFVKVTTDETARYNQDPKAYSADAQNLEKIARLTGSKTEDIALFLAGNRYPSAQEQVELLTQNFADAIKKTAEFLKSQGKVEEVKADYLPYVTNQFAKQALEAK